VYILFTGLSTLCDEQLEVCCSFNIPVFGFVSPSPYFRAEVEIAPHFAKKFAGALIRRLVVAKRHNTGKQENVLSKEG